jgi:hypothetical protein
MSPWLHHGHATPPATRSTYRREDHLLAALAHLLGADTPPPDAAGAAAKAGSTGTDTTAGNTAATVELAAPSAAGGTASTGSLDGHIEDQADELVQRLRSGQLLIMCGDNDLQLAPRHPAEPYP